MALFDYRCPRCKRTWTENRDRNDEDLDLSIGECWCVDGETYNHEGPFLGDRVKFFEQAEAPVVYFHGRGWARVDKNYSANGK